MAHGRKSKVKADFELPALPAQVELISSTTIASLWSNYGRISRLTVSYDSAADQEITPASTTLILKSIHPPNTTTDASESHLRKLLSYEVERWFYHHLGPLVPSTAKLARAYPLPGPGDSDGNLLLEDLAVAYPYPARGSLGIEAAECVLAWLADFHAAFWRADKQEALVSKIKLVPPPAEVNPRADFAAVGAGIWEQGTYWYLETRREELAEISEDEHGWLLPWVEKVNDALRNERSEYGTILHGDVKGANIVFSHSPYRRPAPATAGTDVSQPALRCALYDLQYVGLGLPTHDLVYFLGTTVDASLLEPAGERALLRFYYDRLVAPIASTEDAAAYTFDVFIRHWELSIVDWYRFMAGWGFWGNDSWAERRAREVISRWNAGGWAEHAEAAAQ